MTKAKRKIMGDNEFAYRVKKILTSYAKVNLRHLNEENFFSEYSMKYNDSRNVKVEIINTDYGIIVKGVNKESHFNTWAGVENAIRKIIGG